MAPLGTSALGDNILQLGTVSTLPFPPLSGIFASHHHIPLATLAAQLAAAQLVGYRVPAVAAAAAAVASDNTSINTSLPHIAGIVTSAATALSEYQPATAI